MQKLGSSTKEKTSAVYLLAVAMNEIANINIASDVEQFVKQGKAVELPKDLFTEDCSLSWVERPGFHRGFDVEATQANGNVISGVVENGPAWNAGLRNGMLLVKRAGGEIGNSQVEIAYEVKDGDKPRTLKWMPTGSTTERYRMLKLCEGLSPEKLAACAARLGGRGMFLNGR